MFDVLVVCFGVSCLMILFIECVLVSLMVVVFDKFVVGFGVLLVGLFGGDWDDVFVQLFVWCVQQVEWCDLVFGYVWCNLLLVGWLLLIQFVEVDFLFGVCVVYDSGGCESVLYQQVWIISGCVDVMFGDVLYEFYEGDCLVMWFDQLLIFSNLLLYVVCYVVVICDVFVVGVWSM